jgi:hypothetical protein
VSAANSQHDFLTAPGLGAAVVDERCSPVGARGGIDRGCLVAERAVPSAVVVVLLPVADHDAGLGQAPENVDVQAFVADPGVERLDVAVAPPLAGRDEVQPDGFASPVSLPQRVLHPAGRMEQRQHHFIDNLDDHFVGYWTAVDQEVKAHDPQTGL